MRLMGVKVLIVTNAAGGLNQGYNVGDIMVIQDHFGLPAVAGNHPLRGPNDDELGPRFIAMSDCYDPALQAMVVEAAEKLKLSNKIRQNGTYCFVSGPCYETKAESRFLQSIGGDSVGMSTIPEVIAAKHCGMKILGLSLITNKVVLNNDKDAVHASHAEVLAAANSAGDHVEGLVKYVISKKVMGAYLEGIPTPSYKRKPVKDSSTCSTTASTGCCLTAACPIAACCDKSKCCLKDCSPCCKVATVIGVAALLGGLFIVLKIRK
jgi:inosine/guanosine/xanthosine phosphorylase family protein